MYKRSIHFFLLLESHTKLNNLQNKQHHCENKNNVTFDFSDKQYNFIELIDTIIECKTTNTTIT